MGSRKTGKARFHLDADWKAHFPLLTTEEYCPAPGFVAIEVPAHMIEEVVEYFMDEPKQPGTVVIARMKSSGAPVVVQLFETGWYTPGSVEAIAWDSLDEPEIMWEPGYDN